MEQLDVSESKAAGRLSRVPRQLSLDFGMQMERPNCMLTQMQPDVLFSLSCHHPTSLRILRNWQGGCEINSDCEPVRGRRNCCMLL